MPNNATKQYDIDDLLYLMSRLRDPSTGCAWDLQQDQQGIINYSIEEIYELADAIENGSVEEIQSELGDVLFQVVFLSRLYQEQEQFAFENVVDVLCQKLVRRHPHVFPAADLYATPDPHVAISDEQIKRQWEQIKQQERESASAKVSLSVFDDIPLGLPAILRAEKLLKRAESVGRYSESDELPFAVDVEAFSAFVASEMRHHEDAKAVCGELLFVCVQLARRLGVQAEASLRDANARFAQYCDADQQ